MSARHIEYWVIPPECDGEFAARMEDVLDLYAEPYNPDCPVICMDEQPKQLVKEVRAPISATLEHPERVVTGPQTAWAGYLIGTGLWLAQQPINDFGS